MALWMRVDIVSFLLICCQIQKVTSNEYLSTDTNILSRNDGDNATVSFHSYVNSITPVLFILEINSKEIASGLENDFKRHYKYSFPKLESRLNNIWYNNKTYHVTIKNLSLPDDNTEIKASLIYLDTSQLLKSKQQIVKLKVLYDAALCNDDVMSNMTSLQPATNNNVTVNICGNPKPLLVWYHDATQFSDTSLIARDVGNYKYSHTAFLNMEMCGRNISIRLAENGRLVHSWKVELAYAPEVTINRAYVMEKCAIVKWTPIKIGNCSPVIIEAQFVHHNGTVFYNTNVTMDVAMASFCHMTSQENVTVKIRSKFMNFTSKWVWQDLYVVKKDLIFIESNKNVGILGSSIDIPFYLINNDANILIQSMFVNINDDEAAVGLKTNFKKSVSNPLSSRLKASYNETNFAYSIRINELNLLDVSTISGFIYYFVNSDLSKVKLFLVNTTLDVKGGPTFCGKEFPKQVILAPNQSHFFNFTLCGNPLTNVQWWMEGFPLDYELIEKTGNQYTYKLAIHNVTHKMCGKNIYLLAKEENNFLYREMKVIVDFTPQLTQIMEAFSISHCIYIKWNSQPAGNCDGDIKYDVELVVEPNNNIAVTRYDLINTQTTYCNSAYLAIEKTIVRVRAKFRDIIGEWNMKKLDILTSTTQPTVHTNANNITGRVTVSQGNNAIFRFQLDSNHSGLWNFRHVILSANNSEVAYGFRGDLKERYTNNNTNTNRIGVSYNDITNEYSIILHKANFEDEGYHTSMAVVSTYNENNEMPFLQQITASLSVVGGPYLCHVDLPGQANLEWGNEVSFQISICGKPKPKVEWQFDGKTTTSDEIIDVSLYRYTYKFRIPKIELSMCGKEIRYKATGYSGFITNATKIFVIGRSPTVSIIASHIDGNSCIYSLWITANVGDCTGLTYEVQYLNNDSTIIHTVNSTTLSNDELCDKSKMAHNITHVRIRSIFQNNNPSEWSTAVVNLTKPIGFTTPSTTTTTTTTTTKSTSTAENTTTTTSDGNSDNNKDDDDDDDVLIASIAGAGGFIFLILLILIVYCCYKKNKIAKPPGAELQKHVIHEYDVRNIQTRSNSHYKTTAVNSSNVRAQHPSPIVQSVSNENVLYLNNLSYQEDEGGEKGVSFNQSSAPRHNPAFEMEEMDDGYGTSNGISTHARERQTNGHMNGHAQS